MRLTIILLLFSGNLFAQQICFDVFEPKLFKFSIVKEAEALAVTPAGLKSLVTKYSSQYPEFRKVYDNIGEGLSLQNKVNKFEEIPLNFGSSYRPLSNEKLIERFYTLNSKDQAAILAAYNILNDSQVFTKYLRELYTETFHRMVVKRLPTMSAEDNIITQGKITARDFSIVLISRFKRRGNNNFTRISNNYSTPLKIGKRHNATPEDMLTDNSRFRTAIKTGPFIDDTFSNTWDGDHGVYTHIFQRDYVREELVKIYGEDTSPFYQLLGSKKGISFWADLFDSDAGNSLTSPESTSRLIGRFLKFGSL